jgi:hypothetical protein
MGNLDAHTKTAIGFLTVVEHAQHGLFGGYLVLNACGRPLEFHCTAPVKPNRAQEILYGPTLQGFLYGEQIGQTLLGRGSRQPLLVCTDCEPVLAMRPFVSMPVALVLPGEADTPTQDPTGRRFRVDGPHAGPRLTTFQLGVNRLAVAPTADDPSALATRFAELVESFDLLEPFGRIRAAIDEAQQAVR